MSDIIEEEYEYPYEGLTSEPEESYLTTDEILARNRTRKNTEGKKDLDIPCCWSNLKNDEYAPAYITVPKVPAGVYEIGWNGNLQTHTLKKQPFKTSEIRLYYIFLI